MKISFDKFSGIVPRMADLNKPYNVAHVAHDVNLEDGIITSWRDTKAIKEASDAVSIASIGCCIIDWDTCVHVAPTSVDRGRYAIVGRKHYAEYISIQGGCTPVYSRLGVPMPTSILYAETQHVDVDRDTSPTMYVYTYENEFGEEGAPSYPSNEVFISDEHNTNVIINGFVLPPPEYKIKNINIYRTATAFRDGTEKEQIISTGYLLVAKVPVDTNSFIDNKKILELGMPLLTEDFREPPLNMSCIVTVQGSNTLVGFRGNKVFFSQQNRPHNWPAAYDLTLDHNIINMCSIDGDVFVTTTAYPYVIKDAATCEERVCRTVLENTLESPLPDIACGYRSAVSTPFGMVYSSIEGLVLVIGNSSTTIITKDLFSREQWRALQPHTVRLAYWNGYLVCVTNEISFMLKLDSETRRASGNDILTTISDKPIDMITSSTGELLLLQDGFIYQWNASNKLRKYLWSSSLLDIQSKYNINAIRIGTCDVEVSILDDKDKVLFNRKIVDNKAHRVSRYSRRRSIRLVLTGTYPVEYVQIGTSILDISG